MWRAVAAHRVGDAATKLVHNEHEGHQGSQFPAQRLSCKVEVGVRAVTLAEFAQDVQGEARQDRDAWRQEQPADQACAAWGAKSQD